MHPRTAQVKAAIALQFTPTQELLYGLIVDKTYRGWSTNYSSFYTELPPNDYGTTPGEQAGVFQVVGYNADGFPLWNNPPYRSFEGLTPKPYNPLPPPVDTISVKTRVTATSNPKIVQSRDTIVSTVRVSPENAFATLYWKYVGDGVDTSYFSDLSSLTGSVAMVNGQATISATLADTLPLRTEPVKLSVRFYADAGFTQILAGDAVSIITPEFALSSLPSTLDPGDTLTNNLIFSNIDPTTVVYWRYEDALNPGTVIPAGYFLSSQGSLTLQNLRWESQVLENIANDLSMVVRVYKEAGRVTVLAESEVQINRSPVPVPVFTGFSVSPLLVNEGQSFTSTVTGQNIAPGTPIYWELSGQDVLAQYFNPAQLRGQEVFGAGQSVSWTTNVLATLPKDLLIKVAAYSSPTYAASTVIGTPQNVLAKDTTPPPTVSLALTGSPLSAGGALTASVTSQFVLSKTLYWTATGPNISDFIQQTSGTISLDDQGEATWQIDAKSYLPGNITGTITVYLDAARTQKADQKTFATIGTVTYLLQTTPPTLEPLGTVNNLAVTTNVPQGTTLYWSYDIATPAYINGPTEGSVIIDASGLADWQSTIADGTTVTTSETLTVNLYDSATRTNLVATSTAQINPFPSPAFYALSTNKPSGVIEADTFTVAVSATNNTLATVYYKVTGPAATLSTLTAPVSGPITLTDLKTGSVTLSLSDQIDPDISASGTFTVNIYDNPAFSGTPLNDTPLSIQLRAPEFLIAINPEALLEGSTFDIELQAANVPNGQQYYYKLNFNEVTPSDFLVGDPFGTLTVNNGQAVSATRSIKPTVPESITFTVTLFYDSNLTQVIPFVTDTATIQKKAPVYTLSILPANGGQNNTTFTLTVTTSFNEVPAGTILNWVYSGITSAYVTDGKLSGQVTLEPDGSTSWSSTLAKYLPSSPNPLTVKIYDNTFTQVGNTISGWPITQKNPAVTITPTPDAIDPGQTSVVEIAARNIADGQTVFWEVSPLVSSDVVSVKTGTATISGGKAFFSVQAAAVIAEPDIVDLSVYDQQGGRLLGDARMFIRNGALPPTGQFTLSSGTIAKDQIVTASFSVTNYNKASVRWRVFNNPKLSIAYLTALSGTADVVAGSGQWQLVGGTLIPETITVLVGLYDQADTGYANPFDTQTLTIQGTPVVTLNTFPPQADAGDTITNTVAVKNNPSITSIYFEYTGVNSTYFQPGTDLSGTLPLVSGGVQWSAILVDPINTAATMTVSIYDSPSKTTLLAPATQVTITSTPIPPSYQLTASKSSVIENDTFDINVLADNSPLTEVWYEITGAGVAALATPATGSIPLTSNSTQGVKTIAIESDLLPTEEGPLVIRIYADEAHTGSPLTPSVTVNANAPRFTTVINPDALDEGAAFAIEVNALYVPSTVTAYWRLSASGSADINQFVDGIQGAITLTSGFGSVSKAVKASIPGSTEMTVDIYEDSGYTKLVASDSAAISKIDPTYVLSSDKPSASDGQTVTFTLTTTNVSSGTPLFWRVTGATTSVFAPGTSLTGSLNVDLNSAQWAMTFADTIPNNGTLVAQVYLDNTYTQPVGNPVNVTYATIKIPTYNFTTFPLSVTGGDTFTTSVTTTYVNAGTVLYAQYTGISAADLVDGNLQPTVTIGADGKGTFSSTLKTPITASSTCTIRLYKDAARTIQAGTDVTTVAVSPNPVPPSYQLTTSKTSVIEASTFDINVLANNSPLTQVWYEITGAGTAALVTSATGSIPLTSNSTQGVKTITIKSDLLPTEEGPLVINIFGDGTFTGSPLTPPVTVNAYAPRYTTVINPDALEEGSAFAIQVNALYVPSTVTAYWRLSASGPIDIGQFVDGVQGAVTLTSGVGSVSKAIKASIPGSTEMTVGIYEDPGYTRLVASDSASVSKVDPTYVLSSNKPSVTDGETATFTLRTTNVAPGQTLYWKVTGATTSDFTAGTQLNGNLTISSNTAQWTMTFADPLPNNGTLVAQVYSDNAYTQPLGNSISVPYATSKIPTYNFTTFPGSVTGGDTFTTSVTTQYVDEGTILYAQYSGISNTTLVGGDLFPTVTIGADGKGTFSSTLKYPITSSPTCTIRLYKDASRLVRAGNDINSVAFVPNPVPAYQMTTTKSAVIESDTFDINVLANNSPLSTVYYEITGATDALVSPSTGPITLTSNSTSGVQTIQIEPDITPAEEGTLFIKIFDNPEGTGTALTPTVSVSVTGPVFTTVFNPTTLSEGSAFDIEVQALHVPDSVTAYWRLSASAPADINQFVDGIEGPITLTSGSGSVSKAVKADIPGSTEMTVKIYEDSGFTQFAASNIAPISKTDPTYILSSNASSAVDGQTVTFSLTTTNVGQGKQLFWRVTGATTSVFAAGTSLTGDVTVISNFAQWVMTFADPIPNSGTLVAQAYLDNAYSQPVGNSVSVSYASAKVPTYTFVTTPTSVTGGQTFTTTVTTKFVNAGTTLYAEYTGVPAADIFGGNLTPTVTIGADGKGTFSSTLIDPITANATCTIRLYKDAARTIRAGTDATTVSITPNPIQPDYVIKSNNLDLIDGGNLQVDITGVPDALIYYQYTGPGASSFLGGTTGSTQVTGGVGSWNTPVINPITEGGEFNVSVYDRPIYTPAYLVSNTLTGKVTHIEPAEFSIVTGSKILYNGYKFKVAIDAKNFGIGTLYYKYSSSTPGVVTSDCFVSKSLTGEVTTDSDGQGFWIGQLVPNCPSVGGAFNVTLYLDEDLQIPVGNVLTLTIVPITVSVTLNPLPGMVNSGTTIAINGSTSSNLPPSTTFFWKWDQGAENLYTVTSPLSGTITSEESRLYREQLTLRYPGYDLPPASRPSTVNNTFNLYADSDYTQELANLSLTVNRIPSVQFPDTQYLIDPAKSATTWTVGLISDDPKLAGKKLIIYIFGEGVESAPVTVAATALATETATQINGQTSLLSNFVLDQKHTLTFTYPALTPENPQGDVVFTLRVYDGSSGKLDLNAPIFGDALFNIRYNPPQPFNTFQVLPTVITGGLTTGAFASIEDVNRPPGTSIFWSATAPVPLDDYFSSPLAGVVNIQSGATGFQLTTSATPPPADIVVDVTAYIDPLRDIPAYAPQYSILTNRETSQIRISGYMDNDAWRYEGGFNQAQPVDYWRPGGLTADDMRPILADFDRFYFDANFKPLDTGIFYTPSSAESSNPADKVVGQALKGGQWNPQSGDNYGNGASDTTANNAGRPKGAIYNALLSGGGLTNMVLTFGGPRNAEFFNVMNPETAANQMGRMANLTGAIGINLYYDSNGKSGYYQPDKLLALAQALRNALPFETELHLSIRASQDNEDTDNRLACVTATQDLFDVINLITFTNRSTLGVQWNQTNNTVEEAGGVTDSMITLSRYLTAGVDRTKLQLVLALFGSNNSETQITNPEALAIGSNRQKLKDLTASFHSIVTNNNNPPTLAEMNIINRWKGSPDWMRAWELTSTFQPGGDSQGYFPGFGILNSPAIDWNFPTPLTITDSVEGASNLGTRGVVLWNLESDYFEKNGSLPFKNWSLINSAKDAAGNTPSNFDYSVVFFSPIPSTSRVISPGSPVNWQVQAKQTGPTGTVLYWRYENINAGDFTSPVSGQVTLDQTTPDGFPKGSVFTTVQPNQFSQNTTPVIGVYSDAQYLNRVAAPFSFFMVGGPQTWTLNTNPENLGAGSDFENTLTATNVPRQTLYYRYTGPIAPYVIGGTEGAFLYNSGGSWTGTLNGQIPFSVATLTISVYTNSSRDAAFLVASKDVEVRNDALIFTMATLQDIVDSGNPLTGTVKQTGYNSAIDRYLVFSDPGEVLVSRAPVKVRLQPDTPLPFSLSTVGLRGGTVTVSLRDTPTSTRNLATLTYTVTANPFKITAEKATYYSGNRIAAKVEGFTPSPTLWYQLDVDPSYIQSGITSGSFSYTNPTQLSWLLADNTSLLNKNMAISIWTQNPAGGQPPDISTTVYLIFNDDDPTEGLTLSDDVAPLGAIVTGTIFDPRRPSGNTVYWIINETGNRTPVSFDSNNRASFDFTVTGNLYGVLRVSVYEEATGGREIYGRQFLTAANDNSPLELTGYVDVADWRNTGGYDQALAQNGDYKNPNMVANQIRNQFTNLDNFGFETEGIVLPDGRISGSTSFDLAQQFLDWPTNPNLWNNNTGTENGGPDGNPLYSELLNTRVKGSLYNLTINTPNPGGKTLLTIGGNFLNLDNNKIGDFALKVNNLLNAPYIPNQGTIGVTLLFYRTVMGDLNSDKLANICSTLRDELGPNKEIRIRFDPFVYLEGSSGEYNIIETAVACQAYVDGIELKTYDWTFSSNYGTPDVFVNPGPLTFPPPHQTGVAATVVTASTFINRGITPSKLFIGIPCFGLIGGVYSLSGMPPISFYSTYGEFAQDILNDNDRNKIASGSWTGTTYTINPNPTSSADYAILDPKGTRLWTFDSVETITRKVVAANRLGLGGIFLGGIEKDYSIRTPIPDPNLPPRRNSTSDPNPGDMAYPFALLSATRDAIDRINP